MRFLTTVAAIAAIALLGSCDNTLEPNTDVGLRVWADVSPRILSIRDTAATLRIRVYVENGSSQEITVVSGGPPYRFTDNPVKSNGLWGSARIANSNEPLNAGPNVDWWGDSVYTFRPKSRDYNELTVSLKYWRDGGWPLIPGQYTVRAWFNAREGGSAAFVLRP